MLKNRLRIILVIVITAILVSGISVYATYNYLSSEVKYTKEDGTTVSVENALNELYDNKKTVIYVGSLNTPSGNVGEVSTSFDIKNIYEDYNSLTIDDFVYQVSYMYCHWNNNPGIIGSAETLSKQYNPETGIFTIKNAYQISGFNSGFVGNVYLIPNL